MSKDQADDVLEFLDSLPEGQQGGADSKGAKEGDNSDILDFLDELESKNTTSSLKPAKNKKSAQPKAKENEEVKATADKSESQMPQDFDEHTTPATTPSTSSNTEDSQTHQFGTQLPNLGSNVNETIINPLSTWWGNSGSKQLNSFWGSATSVVEEINKTAQEKIKDYDSINPLTDKFESVLSSVVTTIKNTTKQNLEGDETLKIFVINDNLTNFDYIDYLIYNKFHEVVDQVEGSINLEITNSKNFSKLLNFMDLTHLTNADNDLKQKEIDFFKGNPIDAEKLSLANIDESIKTFVKMRVAKKATQEEAHTEKEKDVEAEANSEAESGSDSSLSHIFITILPVAQENTNKNNSNATHSDTLRIQDSNGDCFQFLITLKDLEHKFTIVVKSQSFPIAWAGWLTENKLKEESADMGVEPSEWVKNWIKDGLALSFGVLAQSYVTKRMGF